MWAQRGGMTAALDDTDRARLARGGAAALTAPEGMALFDAALGAAEPVLVPMKVDLAVLRAQASAGTVPGLLRDLVPPPRDRTEPVRADGPADRLADRLAAATGADRSKLLLDVVRREAAAVLGHTSPAAIAPDQVFTDIGFDSLSAVELRDRLAARTGLRLPASFAFDHPTPSELVEHLSGRLGGGHDGDRVLAELARLESAVADAGPDGPPTGLGTRLRALLARVETAAPAPAGDVAARLESASAADVLAFIDDEFGPEDPEGE
ncbi:acyl carrier protein [Streptomyces sp. A13(2022)]